jgi:hypothetical protein
VLGSRTFFRAGFQGPITLTCYRLAKLYGCHPNEFLGLPVSEIQRHIYWTNTMLRDDAERQSAEEAWRG